MDSFSSFLKKSTIPFFVFITGACVLIIEILATRILAPYFGNTIFALSSVISVVLGALSLGYFFGGKLADKYPSEKLFYGIVAAGGVCIIVLHVLGIIFLQAFGYQLSIIQGPIIASILLFFAQNFLLGMLSPFAIKLQTLRVQGEGIGSVSGQIFFWSTLGSIFGSLSAGFFLIPHFGINRIILSAGFLLILLGCVAMLKLEIWVKFLLVTALSLIFFYMSHITVFADAKNVVYGRDGTYQKIVIYNGTYDGRPARFLLEDRDASAAEFTGSNDLVYPYTKYFALYQIFNPDIKNALMIGGGAYSVPKALLAAVPGVNINVAEIEPTLFNLGKQYFNVPDNPRLHNGVEDGRRLLVDSPEKYDMIFSDAYSSIYSTPSHLTTQQFFTIAKHKLNPDGIFMANVIGSFTPGKTGLLFSEMKTFKSVFPNSYFFAVNSPSYPGLQNIIFCGYNSVNQIDLASPSIRQNTNPIIANLASQQININKLNFTPYPILTDDFSPIEYLAAKELAN